MIHAILSFVGLLSWIWIGHKALRHTCPQVIEHVDNDGIEFTGVLLVWPIFVVPHYVYKWLAVEVERNPMFEPPFVDLSKHDEPDPPGGDFAILKGHQYAPIRKSGVSGSSYRAACSCGWEADLEGNAGLAEGLFRTTHIMRMPTEKCTRCLHIVAKCRCSRTSAAPAQVADD